MVLSMEGGTAAAAAAVLLALCISCLLLFFRRTGPGGAGRLPPGPRPLPIVGNLFHLNAKNMVKSLLALSKRYGSVYTIYLCSQPVVVLCGYQAMKEALVDQGEEFSGRGDMPILFSFTQGNGIVLSQGEKWKALRHFALQKLRNFGMGKRSIEERIQEEAQCLVEELAKTKAPLDPSNLINLAISNVICSIVFGDRFHYEDEEILTLVGLLRENFEIMSSPYVQMYNIFPRIMDYLPGSHNNMFSNLEKLRLFILELVKKHQATLDPNCPRDFVDSFLLKMQQEKGNACSYFHMDSLVMSTHNLFFAGTETVSTTLRYGILVLMKYPEIAAKVQDEIGRVIGSHRSPTMADRGQMPYTDAVIHEIQRFIDVAPLGAPHAVIRDTNFRGYLLPKGTNIITFLYSVHKDPTQFKNPEMFDPTNFLDEKGEFRRRDGFMPFSAGKRVCLGESLARVEMFLFFTTLLQRFAFQPTCPPEQLDLSPIATGIGNIPPLYKFYAIPR
ncbi:cytochrome P450 2F3-like isoform X2 [Elgaria multicarinata webbii]|uniref:cytochrome P450 2F3-like isoform X2 n=1 Tax=Elgaria multicarinata webbii TaxID=159646 RepID=UPI002FCCC2C7